MPMPLQFFRFFSRELSQDIVLNTKKRNFWLTQPFFAFALIVVVDVVVFFQCLSSLSMIGKPLETKGCITNCIIRLMANNLDTVCQ